MSYQVINGEKNPNREKLLRKKLDGYKKKLDKMVERSYQILDAVKSEKQELRVADKQNG